MLSDKDHEAAGVAEGARDASRMMVFLALCVVCLAPCVALYLLCR